MSDLPESWAEVYDRLGRVLASEATAREWVRQALEAVWGVAERRDLPVVQRALALQRLSGVLMRLEAEQVDLAFTVGARGIVREAFARHFEGAFLDGPPWRLDPSEERPSYTAWMKQADFEEVTHGS